METPPTLTVAILLIGILCAIWLYWKVGIKPVLRIAFKVVRVHSMPPVDSEAREADDGRPRQFQIIWDMMMEVENTSRHRAFDVRVHMQNDYMYFSRYQGLQLSKPIAPHEQRQIMFEVVRTDVCTPADIRDGMPLPAGAEGLEFVVEYKSVSGVHYFTRYTHRDATNRLLRRRVDGFGITRNTVSVQQLRKSAWKTTKQIGVIIGIAAGLAALINTLWPDFFKGLFSR